MESYKEAEIDEYMFIATLDMRTSKQCQQQDKKVYKVIEAIPGVNMPPMHVFCRSTTRAYFGEEFHTNIQRRARNPITGKNELVPADTNYDEWRKGLEEKHGKEKVDMIQKQIQNKSTDKKQYNQYKVVLGKNAPKSFAAFLDMKYTKGKEWEKIVDNHYVKSRLNDGVFGLIINPEKQAPHMESTKKEGKSYFYDDVDVQKIFNQYAGTGTIERDSNGKRKNTEIIDITGDVAVVQNKEKKIPANQIKIHHSKKRTHIVPRYNEERG